MNLPRTPLSFIWFVVKKSRGWAIGAFIAVTIAEILGNLNLLVLRALTDAAAIVVADHFSESALSGLWFWAIAFPLIYFITENIWRTSGICGMRLITRSEAFSSKFLFNYLIEHSSTYFNSRFAGSLVNKIGHVSRGTHHMLSGVLWNFYPMVIGIIANVVIVSTINIYLGFILIGWLVLFLGINYYVVRRKQHLSYASATAHSIMKGKMVDTVSNISTVHVSAQHEYERKFVGGYIAEHQKKSLKSWIASEWILFMNGLLLALFIFGMVAVTVVLIKQGLATIGSLVLVITMTLGLQDQLFFIGSKMTDTIDEYSEIDEGLRELVVPYDIEDKYEAGELSKAKGSIRFEKVNFKFGRNTVFKDFSLEIVPGQKVGMVGVSGAGKSTLINLLLRNYDIDSGQILVDNNDIRDITRKSLREQIAFVPQDISLFHRTIGDNIRYGRLDATDEEVVDSAKNAQADEFIKVLSEGYETFVGERGVKLSGGQRQRVAISRAFLKQAPVLILDEATSALDSQSEVLVQAALAQLMQGRTVVAVAHRLSTLRVMDRIVVMDKGRIVEDGTHDELVEKGGHYAELWEKQVEGFIG